MPIRINGGVFNDQMVTGSLRHFVLFGADFSGAVNSFGEPVAKSAAEIIFSLIAADGAIDIMNPNQFNISFALETNRSSWDATSLTTMVQSLGSDVGVDHVNCTLCVVSEVPYILSLGGDMANNYTSVPAGTVLEVGRRYFVTDAGTVTLPALAGSNFQAGWAVSITKNIGIVVTVVVGDVLDIIKTDQGTTNAVEMDVSHELIFVYDGVSSWDLQIGSVVQ